MRRRSYRSVLVLCAGLSALLAPIGCGGDKKAPPARTRIIDRARAIGDRPAAKASATVARPVALAIRVSAAPTQRVAVVWALSCTNAKGADARTSGASYSTLSPNIRALKLPDGPTDVCALEATARILTGRVKTTLLATSP